MVTCAPGLRPAIIIGLIDHAAASFFAFETNFENASGTSQGTPQATAIRFRRA